MSTFDQVLPIACEVLNAHREYVSQLDWLLINRDLNGRVRFIAPESVRTSGSQHAALETLYQAFAERVGSHAFAVESGILFEANQEQVCQGATSHKLTAIMQRIDRCAGCFRIFRCSFSRADAGLRLS